MSDDQESMDLFGDMHPYNKIFQVYSRLPEKGRDGEEVLKEVAYMSETENQMWQGGQCSGTMYHGGMEHYAFLNKVFSMYSYANLLQRDLCPSGTKFEAEVLAMIGRMLGRELPVATATCAPAARRMRSSSRLQAMPSVGSAWPLRIARVRA